MVQITIDKPPKCHLPMRMANDDNDLIQPTGQERMCRDGKRRSMIITQQPSPQSAPKMDMDDEMTLRGGRMTLGFNCCGGHCNFNKGCC